MNELNNPGSELPAYVRFQIQDDPVCRLRADLRQHKDKCFRSHFEKELEKPRRMMQKVYGKDQPKIDGTNYYEMKYFLTDKQRAEVQVP